MNYEQYTILAIEEEYQPIITESECRELKPVIEDFIQTYIKNKDNPCDKWLGEKIKSYLPDKTLEEVNKIVDDIIYTIKTSEKKKDSLNNAISNGRNKESWFVDEVKKATSAMSTQQTVEYLDNLDNALSEANESLQRAITTKSGNINNNPCLDGFIAEQYHAQTFNMNAETIGSPYRAKVLEPNGNRYGKNSVDIVIFDENGKTIKRYQSKYCKNAESTIKAFEDGDYRGQQKLVPDDQMSEIKSKGIKCTSIIEADGISSNPLCKSKAEQMRNEAQSGNWNDLNWNEYKTKDLSVGIAKQTVDATLKGMTISVGVDIAKKVINGEEIKSEEVIENALISGADFGVKAATAGALKVGIEKGIIKGIPKGTHSSVFANIAHIAVENLKIAGKITTGEFTVKEGIEKMEQTTISTAAGLMAMEKGTLIGASIGSVFGVVGTALGGFAGGTIGYIAGSKVGQKCTEGAQKLKECVKELGGKIIAGGKSRVEKVLNFFGI